VRRIGGERIQRRYASFDSAILDDFLRIFDCHKISEKFPNSFRTPPPGRDIDPANDAAEANPTQ
jgi:hypothetical protein